MKKLSLALLASTILTGFSVAQGAASLPVEGSWGMRQAEGAFTFDMTFTIQNGTLTLTNLCGFQGQTSSARVSSPAQYDDRTITTMMDAHDEESANGVNCNVSIKADRMNYQVVGSTLVLSHEGSSDQIVLNRK